MTRETDTKELHRVPQRIEDREFEVLASTVKVEFGGLSHTAKVRPINEDHYLITRLGRDQETLLSIKHTRNFWGTSARSLNTRSRLIIFVTFLLRLSE